MYHFLQYLYHFILSCYDIGCPIFRQHIQLWFCWSLHLQQLVRQNLFFWILNPLGGGGFVHAGHGLLSLHSSYTKFKGNSIFFVPNSNLCRAMLPNYLMTYSSALCQIRAIEKAFKKQNNGQSVPTILILVLNACIWLARTNTQNLHAILYVWCL